MCCLWVFAGPAAGCWPKSAQQLQDHILSDSDIIDIFSAATDVMELCRKTQKTYLDDLTSLARAGADERLIPHTMMTE